MNTVMEGRNLTGKPPEEKNKVVYITHPVTVGDIYIPERRHGVDLSWDLWDRPPTKLHRKGNYAESSMRRKPRKNHANRQTNGASWSLWRPASQTRPSGNRKEVD